MSPPPLMQVLMAGHNGIKPAGKKAKEVKTVALTVNEVSFIEAVVRSHFTSSRSHSVIFIASNKQGIHDGCLIRPIQLSPWISPCWHPFAHALMLIYSSPSLLALSPVMLLVVQSLLL